MKLFVAIAFILSLTNSALGKTLTASQKDNKVSWIAVGFPGFLKIVGEGGKVEGILLEENGKASGSLKVNVAKFSTGMELRDEHMHKKFLGSDIIPEATLTINPVEVKAGAIPFTGKLQIKSDTKPVAGELILKPVAGGWSVKGSFAIKLTDYPSIGVPSHLGITVAEKVDISVDLVFDEK